MADPTRYRITMNEDPSLGVEDKDGIWYLVAEVDPILSALRALLQEAKRDHYHCDDSWYCCRACRHPDHGLEEGEHLWDGHDDSAWKLPAWKLPRGACTCGADAWNARVEAALAGKAEPTSP